MAPRKLPPAGPLNRKLARLDAQCSRLRGKDKELERKRITLRLQLSREVNRRVLLGKKVRIQGGGQGIDPATFWQLGTMVAAEGTRCTVEVPELGRHELDLMMVSAVEQIDRGECTRCRRAL